LSGWVESKEPPVKLRLDAARTWIPRLLVQKWITWAPWPITTESSGSTVIDTKTPPL
jgi:hypothetical protein